MVPITAEACLSPITSGIPVSKSQGYSVLAQSALPIGELNHIEGWFCMRQISDYPKKNLALGAKYRTNKPNPYMTSSLPEKTLLLFECSFFTFLRLDRDEHGKKKAQTMILSKAAIISLVCSVRKLYFLKSWESWGDLFRFNMIHAN